jgi:hypothetical protein
MTKAFDDKLWQLIRDEVMGGGSMTWDEVFVALATMAAVIIVNDPEYTDDSANEYSERVRRIIENEAAFVDPADRVIAPKEIRSMTLGETIELLVERQLERLPEQQRAAVRASWERTKREEETK